MGVYNERGATSKVRGQMTKLRRPMVSVKRLPFFKFRVTSGVYKSNKICPMGSARLRIEGNDLTVLAKYARAKRNIAVGKATSM